MNHAHRPVDDWPVVTVRGFIGSLFAALALVAFAFVMTVAVIVSAP